MVPGMAASCPQQNNGHLPGEQLRVSIHSEEEEVAAKFKKNGNNKIPPFLHRHIIKQASKQAYKLHSKAKRKIGNNI